MVTYWLGLIVSCSPLCITPDDLKIRGGNESLFSTARLYILCTDSAFTDLPWLALPCLAYSWVIVNSLEIKRMDFRNDPFYNVNIKRFFQVKYKMIAVLNYFLKYSKVPTEKD